MQRVPSGRRRQSDAEARGRSCAAARRSLAPSSPVRRERPRAPPALAASDRSAEPKWRSSARRRAGPTPSSVVEERLARLRRRGAGGGSRARSGAPRPGSVGAIASPALCGSSRIGSGRPGTNTSSTRFASAITATRGRSYACIAASAAESCPLPPSITTRFGAAAKPSSYSCSRRAAEPREAARDDLRHRREVVLPVEPAHARTCGSAPSSGRASWKTTIEPTICWPWMFEMS